DLTPQYTETTTTTKVIKIRFPVKWIIGAICGIVACVGFLGKCLCGTRDDSRENDLVHRGDEIDNSTRPPCGGEMPIEMLAVYAANEESTQGDPSELSTKQVNNSEALKSNF